MESLLIHSRKWLAEERARNRVYPDPDADWYGAEQELIGKQAYFRAQKIPEAAKDTNGNWQHSKRVVEWRLWVESKCAEGLISPLSRPYLALVAQRGAVLANRLDEVHWLHPGYQACGMIVVLDGAPEAARHCSDESALERTKNKDSTFYEYCRHTVSLFAGRILEAGSARAGHEVADGDRAFQDGSLNVFAGSRATSDAINAALQLKTLLCNLNYRNELNWQEQFHLRAVIASNWEAVLNGMRYSSRDEIFVEEGLFSPLEPNIKRAFMASGVRLMTTK